ncbi:hypothetical protein [Azospirillum sp. SYSU D00513]|uniref:hypothetical protein n=1 Tax=Azospirillum sp. SYSU D00513 TaxID=2812561 RepID=UPI001A96C9F9|nr:hypothetical protein [Azospirillum sp. SYSU D00513]
MPDQELGTPYSAESLEKLTDEQLDHELKEAAGLLEIQEAYANQAQRASVRLLRLSDAEGTRNVIRMLQEEKARRGTGG